MNIRLVVSIITIVVPITADRTLQRRKRPNIIVMQADDLPFFDEWTPPPGGSFGRFPTRNGKLPHLDTLRLDGLEMKQAYATSGECAPSRYSTITGRYPSKSAFNRAMYTNRQTSKVNNLSTRLTDNREGNDCSNDNMAKVFQRNNYRTGFFGKWHLLPPNTVQNPRPSTYAVTQRRIEQCGFDLADGIYVEPLTKYRYETNHNLEWMTELAVDFIKDDETYGNKPFFMYFNPTVPHKFGDVHDALRNGSCRDTPNGRQKEPLIKGMTLEYGKDGRCRRYRQSVLDRLHSNKRGNSLDKDLGVIWIDDAVGALIDALKGKGELENTIFLFQMDHGMGDKSTLKEGGTRIAQFIHYPAEFGTGGKTFDGLVSTIDIAPTLMDYAGIREGSRGYYKMDGNSWKQAISDSNEEKKWNTKRCLLFEYDKDRSIRCGCEKYSEINFSTSYVNLCNRNKKYINYPRLDPENKDLKSTSRRRALMMKRVFGCFKRRTKPSLAKNFNSKNCEMLYETL